MVGLGRIFAGYRDGVLYDDEEIAVLHGPEELGYPALTEAMVNIRATLDRAVSEGVLDTPLATRFTELAKSLFYKERSWDAICRIAEMFGIVPMRIDEFRAWLHGRSVDQKRLDALEMIEEIRAKLAAGLTPLKVSYHFEDTGYHRAAADDGLRSHLVSSQGSKYSKQRDFLTNSGF
jgi:hypothetical protein